jgi:hypothetical protein
LGSATSLKLGVNEIWKENRSGDKSPERLLKTTYCCLPPAARLTDAGAQDTSVVVQAHLAAGKKIRNGCDRFPATVRAGADCQNEVAKRQPGASL